MKNEEFWMMVLAVIVALVLNRLVVVPLMKVLNVREGATDMPYVMSGGW